MQVSVQLRDSADWQPVPLPAPMGRDTVYHYTSAAGAIGIFQSGCLWASSPLALNDTSEFVHGLKTAEDVWLHWPEKDALSERQRQFVDALLFPESAGVTASSVYLLSSSRDDDSLNQWQGYAGQRGYCLGIDTGQHLAVVEPDRSDHAVPVAWTYDMKVLPGWYSVIYDESKQRDSITKLIAFILRMVPPEPGAPDETSAVLSSRMFLGTLLAQIKSDSFEVEREVRYIASAAETFPASFRPGPFGIVPYVKLAPGHGSLETYYAAHQERPLPLTEIVCGPVNSSEKPSVEEAARRLQARYGYSLKVRTSRAPYRF